ncbi:hypothetical protein SUGI_1007400 [Cryptomeria japonica]|nr:hypothetical protein SUGI_1007400 [Cryptomeria japonica]
MDKYKLQEVKKTLERIPAMTIDDLVDKVRELDTKIRACYEDSAVEWDGDTLAWMMAMDACFILEFLRREMLNSSLVFHTERADNIKRREIILDILKLCSRMGFLSQTFVWLHVFSRLSVLKKIRIKRPR